jgi:hypothetical protein
MTAGRPGSATPSFSKARHFPPFPRCAAFLRVCKAVGQIIFKTLTEKPLYIPVIPKQKPLARPLNVLLSKLCHHRLHLRLDPLDAELLFALPRLAQPREKGVVGAAVLEMSALQWRGRNFIYYLLHLVQQSTVYTRLCERHKNKMK